MSRDAVRGTAIATTISLITLPRSDSLICAQHSSIGGSLFPGLALLLRLVVDRDDAIVSQVDCLKSTGSIQYTQGLMMTTTLTLAPPVAVISVLEKEGLLDNPAIRGTGFLDLPYEIRFEIYRHLFQNARLSLTNKYPVAATSQLNAIIPPEVLLQASVSVPLQRRYKSSYPFQLLCTNRTIFDEAVQYLSQSSTIEISEALDFAVSQLPYYYLQHSPHLIVLDAYKFSRAPFNCSVPFPSLQILELRNIVIWCKFHQEAFLSSQEGEPVMISLAMFNLNRIAPCLTDLCERKESERNFEIRLDCHFVVQSDQNDTIVRISLYSDLLDLTATQHALIDVDSQKVLRKQKGPEARSRNTWAGFY